jgi:hypothetical protein
MRKKFHPSTLQRFWSNSLLSNIRALMTGLFYGNCQGVNWDNDRHDKDTEKKDRLRCI